MVAEKTDKSPEPTEKKAETEVKAEAAEETKEVKKETPKKDFAKPCPASKKPKTPTAEQKKPEPAVSNEQSKPSEDATLILSAEEEAEVAAETNEDAVKSRPSEEKVNVFVIVFGRDAPRF